MVWGICGLEESKSERKETFSQWDQPLFGCVVFSGNGNNVGRFVETDRKL